MQMRMCECDVITQFHDDLIICDLYFFSRSNEYYTNAAEWSRYCAVPTYCGKKNTHTYRFSIDQLEICKWFIIGFEISSCVHVRTNQSRSDYLASYDDLISGEKLAFVRLNEWEYN